jgi:hypothetical protein
MKHDHIVIIFDGGIGDHLCATPMIKQFSKIHINKQIIVGAVYPELYYGLEYIDKLYNLRNPGDFFETWVQTISDYMHVIKRDIYNYGAHSLYRKKLSSIISNVYGIGDVDDILDYKITEQENDEAKKFIETFEKPVIVIHCFAANPPTIMTKLTDTKDWFTEKWEDLILQLHDKFSFVQVGLQNESQIKGCDCYLLSRLTLRQVAALLNNCYTWIDVDSFISHLGHAINKKGIVLLGRSHPDIYTHNTNINIFHKNSCVDFGCGRPQALFGDSAVYNGVLQLWQCKKFKRQCMQAITVEEVADAINSIM